MSLMIVAVLASLVLLFPCRQARLVQVQFACAQLLADRRGVGQIRDRHAVIGLVIHIQQQGCAAGHQGCAERRAPYLCVMLLADKS